MEVGRSSGNCLKSDVENVEVMHLEEDTSEIYNLACQDHSEESNESDAALKTIWTTLASGKSSSRRIRFCVLDVHIDDGENSAHRASLVMDEETIDLKNKNLCWMFIAYTCDCCGLRERELFCSLDRANGSSDSAQENFYAKYPSLKAVEAGSDTRKTGRIELMFQDGDTLSVGLECATNDISKFQTLYSALATIGQLVKCECNRCATRRRSPANSASLDQNTHSIEANDEAAHGEADRHMMELLAALEGEKKSKTKASRKQQKKKTLAHVAAEADGTSRGDVNSGTDTNRMMHAVEDGPCESGISLAPRGCPEDSQASDMHVMEEGSCDSGSIALQVEPEDVTSGTNTNRMMHAVERGSRESGINLAPMECPEDSQASDMHVMEEGSCDSGSVVPRVEPEDSQENDTSFILKPIWTTLTSTKSCATPTLGKSSSRSVRSCYLDVRVNEEDDGKHRASLVVEGEAIDLASKTFRWMFTAFTCDCCGLRERELLCPLNYFYAAQEDFHSKYPSLKAVEAGSDARQIGRIEIKFQDGDILSAGLECATNDVRNFQTVCSALAAIGRLVECKSNMCRSRRRSSMTDNQIVDFTDDAASGEADRHMMELLASVDCETTEHARVSRKQQKKKRKGHMAERKVNSSNICISCKPAVEGHDALIVNAVVGEDDPAPDDAGDNDSEMLLGTHETTACISLADAIIEEESSLQGWSTVSRANVCSKTKRRRAGTISLGASEKDASEVLSVMASPAHEQQNTAESPRSRKVEATYVPFQPQSTCGMGGKAPHGSAEMDKSEKFCSNTPYERNTIESPGAENVEAIHVPIQPLSISVMAGKGLPGSAEIDKSENFCSNTVYALNEPSTIESPGAENVEAIPAPIQPLSLHGMAGNGLPGVFEVDASWNCWNPYGLNEPCTYDSHGAENSEAIEALTDFSTFMKRLMLNTVDHGELHGHCGANADDMLRWMSSPVLDAQSAVASHRGHHVEATNASVLPLTTCSVGVQTDFQHAEALPEVEQDEINTAPSHIGDYMLAEPMNSMVPISIVPLVPRAGCWFPHNSPAKVEIAKKKERKLRIPAGSALKATCRKAVDLYSSASDSSDDMDDEISETSTVPCRGECCNPTELEPLPDQEDMSSFNEWYHCQGVCCNSMELEPLSDQADMSNFNEWFCMSHGIGPNLVCCPAA